MTEETQVKESKMFTFSFNKMCVKKQETFYRVILLCGKWGVSTNKFPVHSQQALVDIQVRRSWVWTEL